MRKRLLSWFADNARELPWRAVSGARSDSYNVWVSEIMLQQTQAVMVIPYYERFIARFPNLTALAKADESEVLRHWEGLGYYRRARQMHLAARQLAAAGETSLPVDFDAVFSLPGVGRYTAGAILSIAHDARRPILEANTIRLFSRLTAYAGDVQSAAGQRHLWSFAEAILPQQRVGIFNQALMELGALVCTPKAPACDRCPAQSLCPTFASSLQESIPRPKAAKRYEETFEAALVVEQENSVLLRQCQPGERWAGLWDFPRFALDLSFRDRSDRAIAAALSRAAREHLGEEIKIGARMATIRHGVTRFRITLACFRAQVEIEADAIGPSLAWAPVEEIERFPLSSTGRKIANLVQREREAAVEQKPKEKKRRHKSRQKQ